MLIIIWQERQWKWQSRKAGPDPGNPILCRSPHIAAIVAANFCQLFILPDSASVDLPLHVKGLSRPWITCCQPLMRIRELNLKKSHFGSGYRPLTFCKDKIPGDLVTIW